jgi:PAS domain S-box-containing protein
MKKRVIPGILPDTEKKYRALFKIAPIGISVVDKNLDIIEANKTLEKTAKMSLENLQKGVYKKRKYVHPDGSVFSKSEFPDLIAIKENKIVLDRVVGIVSEDNSVSWTQVSAAPLNLSERYAVVVTQDITDRKSLELKLKASEEKYKAFFENSLDGMMITSQDGSVYSANKASCDMLGYTEEEICSLGRKGLVEQTPELTFGLKKRKESGRYQGELNFLAKNGVRIPVELSSSVFNDADGKQLTAVIIRNIIKRKVAERSLKESEERYRNLFENTPIGISATSQSGQLLEANLPFAKMYGYQSVSQMKSELSSVSKLFLNPDQRSDLLEILKKNGKTDASEFEAVRRDGSRFIVLSSAVEVRDMSGNFLYYQTSHIDLTAQKEIEEALRSASLYTRSLIEASIDPLVTINSDGKITDVNFATEKITGLDRINLIGSDFADYFLEIEKAREGYNTVFLTGSVKDYPLTIRNKNGTTADVLYNATLYKNETGEVQGVFAAARDITVLKKTEAKLRHSRRMLKKLNEHLEDVREKERSDIALNLHDDLGQRLTALNLELSWLRRRIGVQSEVVLNKFNEIGNMINETIDGLKEISSFLRPAILYDLGLVPAFDWQIKKVQEQSGINCVFKYSPAEFQIDSRISLILFRSLQESLTNIIRHSGASNVHVTLVKTNHSVEMLVRDDGKGIKEDQIDSLASMGITGIQERVESVSGSVFIKGQKNRGTIVEVIIPLAKIE